MEERETDPRIALLQEADRRLLMVGNGTLGMVLAAAEKTGIIPAGTATTEYGAQRTPADYAYPQRTAAEAIEQATLLREHAAEGYAYTPVTRTRTVFADAVTDWVPLSAEETHD